MSDSQPKTVTMGKKYQTRDGREVTIYRTGGGGTWSVHGSVKESDRWISTVWRADGNSNLSGQSDWDLMEVGETIKCTMWLNIYHACSAELFHSLEVAKKRDFVFARVRVDIDCAEGEGL